MLIRKFKILIIVLIALVMSALMSNTLFLAGTPYINKPFVAQLINQPGIFVKNMDEYVASLGKGREGIDAYQQEQVQEYVTQQQDAEPQQQAPAGSPQAPAQNPLPPPRSADDYRAQGYSEIGKDVYQKQDVSANTIELIFGENAQFEKKITQVDGKDVEVWRPL